jgi:hypothetical protein
MAIVFDKFPCTAQNFLWFGNPFNLIYKFT